MVHIDYPLVDKNIPQNIVPFTCIQVNLDEELKNLPTTERIIDILKNTTYIENGKISKDYYDAIEKVDKMVNDGKIYLATLNIEYRDRYHDHFINFVNVSEIHDIKDLEYHDEKAYIKNKLYIANHKHI